MTNNRLLAFIAVVLSVLTIAVIFVAVSFSKSQPVVTTTQQDTIAPVIEETTVLEEGVQDEPIIQEPVQQLISGVDYVETDAESVTNADDEYVSAGTGMLYDETDNYHPTTGEPLYWVDGVEVTAKQWYKATGGAQEGRTSLEEIEEMRRDNAPSQY